uniref:Uncharacterized protein n=1 Tax=Entomoneis paludosa TaxID=265537 RepID=A0A7S2Y2K0_9STRA|mmetsp:Transcript_11389/g.23342  ORF Transcript_11389/g.23342 Transcript_11389/m.23342 type:complete len:244 (+) Transcript_11389:12-743(+)|eukprot:CAMPEP_0172461100 /NCGR_PEP_ID=MMETSP1065-20121228/39420_1 /TAXON_ID=265537 /ORGANISM="Amphiprora paludosa, Strain CCMP125" /LENGTH=243 /DNA_ID=CAMNT_0013216317 /DNA_START=1 /DNA_END=732 /DNA_ORIENTATION=+
MKVISASEELMIPANKGLDKGYLYSTSPSNKVNSQDFDEFSLSSTISADNVPSKDPGTHPQERTVHFCESSNVVHENPLCKDDCSLLWHTAEELRHFKAAFSFMARMISHEGEGQDSLQHSQFYTGILENVYEACCYAENVSEDILTRQEKSCLAGLFSIDIGIGRLGLERRSVRKIGRDKQRRRTQLFCLVTTANIEDGLCREDDFFGRNMVAEQLRMQCEQVTLPSRVFAMQLAQAQSAIV